MKRNDPIGVIAAMDSELEQLLGMLEGKAERTICGLQFSMGTLYGRDVVLLKCGIGKVNAARGAQILIDMFHPAALVNTGIAGGLALGLAVGVLDGVEAAAMRAYSEALNSSAQRVGVTADDAPADMQQEAVNPAATVVDADTAAEVQAAFAEQDASQDDFAPLA